MTPTNHDFNVPPTGAVRDDAALIQQIVDLDPELFSFLEAQTLPGDRQALLALHAAAADICGSFAYLEIGSYLGGSLQALMRDTRCSEVMSIDTRTTSTPDARGDWTYERNTTERMRELLGQLPAVDMDKLTTFDGATDTLRPADLPSRPTYCFVDGEHTHDAVLRDAHFCAEALGGVGVIAFHDYALIGSAIRTFLRENWTEIGFALAFKRPRHPEGGGGVFALELGGAKLLRHRSIERAVASSWHSIAWTAASRFRRSPVPLFKAWAMMPAVDSFVATARQKLENHVR